MVKPGGGGVQFEPHVAVGLDALTAAGISVTRDAAEAISAFFFSGQDREEAVANAEFGGFIDTLIALARDKNIRRIDGGIFDGLKSHLCPWHPFC
jgi:hypothetical protein